MEEERKEGVREREGGNVGGQGRERGMEKVERIKGGQRLKGERGEERVG